MSSVVTPVSATTEEVVAELRARSSFMFVSHVKPDGDTLGAGLALGLALKALGKRVGYFNQDPVPRNLRFLPDAELVGRAVPADLPADTLWVFGDMSDWTRAGEFLPAIARENMLNIDHHLGNSRFAQLNYILEKEASTGTCVLRILRSMNVPITPDIATCILTTIMTDTGAFMHTNTTADVLRMSATKLVGIAISTARLEESGRYCWTVVDEAMLAACDADGEDTEEIVQHLRAVEGVEAAALFKDFDGAVRVSLRSSGRVNVQAAAAEYGGGGHFMAAGVTFPGDLAAAIAGVRAALKAQGV
jgi:phosphoesterase RecJ-like protein